MLVILLSVERAGALSLVLCEQNVFCTLHTEQMAKDLTITLLTLLVESHIFFPSLLLFQGFLQMGSPPQFFVARCSLLALANSDGRVAAVSPGKEAHRTPSHSVSRGKYSKRQRMLNGNRSKTMVQSCLHVQK